MTEPIRPDDTSESKRPLTVCGRDMTTDIAWYPHADFHGKRIYFCTEFCLEAFLADPERFYNAHSRKKGNPVGN